MSQLARPLPVALLAFAAGLLPALRFSPPPEPLVLGALAAAVAALALRRRLGPPGRPGVTEVLLLCGFIASGAALGAVDAQSARADCRLRIPDGEPVRVRGVLAAGAGARTPGDAPLLPLRPARLEGRGAPCVGALRVRLPESVPRLPAGTEVWLEGTWLRSSAPVAPTAWPRDADFAGFVAADSLRGTAAPDARKHPLLTLRGITDERLQRLFPSHGALAEALLLGRRERLDPAVRERFARSGLVHLLAISGSHVGLLAAMVLLAGSLARVPRARLSWLTLAATGLYLSMIGAPASAVRAGVMLGLALLARVLQRPSSVPPMMAAAALAILAVEPLAILDAGFQLSFAGVAGILVARRTVLPALPAPWVRRAAVRAPVEALLISAAAFVATAPIVAHHFGQVAPVAVLANLPAVPLLALALAGVVSSMLLAPLSFPLARLLADGTGAALDALDRVATWGAELPLGHFPVPRPQWGLWVASGVVLLLALHLARGLRLRVRAPAAVAGAAALLLVLPALAPAGSGALEVHFLDVGQGDAVAVRTPAGRWLLVDAGPRSRDHDAGERRVLPFLRARGARRLEALILTHADLDHIGGAPAVLRGIPVERVIEPGLPVGKESYLEVLREVEARGIAWSAAQRGRALVIDGVRLEFLWPEEAPPLDDVRETNEISVVVRLRFGHFALLLTGDAPEAVERRLVGLSGDSLRAQVLKAGHHGSATSTSAELLDAVRPELVVVSAGRRNRYGHPAPSVLRRVRERGIGLARTDEEGTVSLRVAPDGWSRIEP